MIGRPFSFVVSLWRWSEDRNSWSVGENDHYYKHQPITIRFISTFILLTHWGYAIVERIAMAKRKASEPLERHSKKINTSSDFVYYQPALHLKIQKISCTKIGKRPIYRFFIVYNGKYFPLLCMLNLGSTSFVISPEATKAFSIPVVKRPRPIKSGGNNLKTENLFTVP